VPSHEQLETDEGLNSKPPPPDGEEMSSMMAEPSHVLEEGAETLNSRPFPEGKKMMPVSDENRASTDVEDSEKESEDESDPRWSSIQRKRARSLDSTKRSLRNKKFEYIKTKKLSTERKETIKAATGLLTEEQKKHVQRRQNRVETQGEEPNPNEAGPSRDKGKTIDPREWGTSVRSQNSAKHFQLFVWCTS
jgi:hypothetical protein